MPMTNAFFVKALNILLSRRRKSLSLERQQTGLIPSIREYMRLYQVNSERLARAKPGVLVMHPGPMNEGIEISPEVAHGAHSLVEEQVSNGVAVRMAVLYLLAGGQP